MRASVRRTLGDPSAWALAAGVAILVVAAVHAASLYRWNAVDDAYISFQYAKNLVHGHGLVFNPGERVEGYTNFLWVLLLAPLFAATEALGVDFTTGAILLSLLFAVASLVVLRSLAARLFGGGLPGSLAIALCVADDAYRCYAMSALENPLLIFCALLTARAWVSDSPRRWLWTGLGLGGVCLCRPDGALFAVAFVVVEGLRGARRDVARAAAVGLAVSGAWFAWRWGYYGALLPNTFYLKVGSSLDGVARGLKYLLSFNVDRFALPAVALGAAALVARRPLVAWVSVWLLAHGAYVVYVGGDFYSGHRYLVVTLPFLALLTATAVHAGLQRSAPWWSAPRSRRTAAALCGAALAAGLAAFTVRGVERGPSSLEISLFGAGVDNNVRYMKWLKGFARPGASMVVGDIGAAGFIADLRVVDVFGVVDPQVARQVVERFGTGKPGHEKVASRAAMLAKAPDLVKWSYLEDLESEGYFLFTDFPPDLDVPGLWVVDELARTGRFLEEPAFHFDDLDGWEREGTAFVRNPARGPVDWQQRVHGARGAFLDSFQPGVGDAATGRLVSPPFPLVGDLLVITIGGGRDAERLRVSLLVDGERVASATGHGKEVLGRRVWDVSGHRGRDARLEVVDDATGPWGHLLVDEVRQWQRATTVSRAP